MIPNLDVELAEGQKAIIVPDPDSITVTGPAHVLDTIGGISTRHRSFNRPNDNFQYKVRIVCPDYLQTAQKRVTVEVTITSKATSSLDLKQETE